MLEVYSHLSGKDVDDKILALHGIRLKPEDQEPTPSVRVCSKEGCGAENTSEAILKDPSFIQGLVKNKEFLEALRKALTAT